MQEVHLAANNATKAIEIPVLRGDAIGFCRDAQDADGVKNTTSSDTVPAAERASRAILPTAFSERDTSEITTASQKLKTPTTSALGIDSDSSSISTPSTLNPMADVLAPSTDYFSDEYGTLTYVVQVLSLTKSTDVTLATQNSEIETDSNDTPSSASSDETEDASETLDSSSLPSRTSSADFASTDQEASSVESTTTISDALEADESDVPTDSTSSKKKKTHFMSVGSDASTPQPTDDTSSLEPMVQDSSIDDSSYDSSILDRDGSTPSAPLANVLGAADEPATPTFSSIAQSNIKSWHNVIKSYMSLDTATATVDLDMVATTATAASADYENGAVRRGIRRAVAGREASVKNPCSTVSGMNSWCDYISSYMQTAGTSTHTLYTAKSRPNARSKPSSNAGVKRVMLKSLIRRKCKRQEQDDDSNDENIQNHEDDGETPISTRSTTKTTKTEAAYPIITKTGKGKGKGKTGDIDKEKDKSEKEAEKSKSKNEKEEKEKETSNEGGDTKETDKNTEKGHPKETPEPAPKDQRQDENKAMDQSPSDKNTRPAPALPSDMSFALASPPTTTHPHSTSPIPSPPPPPGNPSAPSTPIIWGPECIPLHDSSPSNSHDKRTIKGCWRTIIAHQPQASKAWNILSDGQNRQLVFVL